MRRLTILRAYPDGLSLGAFIFLVLAVMSLGLRNLRYYRRVLSGFPSSYVVTFVVGFTICMMIIMYNNNAFVL